MSRFARRTYRLVGIYGTPSQHTDWSASTVQTYRLVGIYDGLHTDWSASTVQTYRLVGIYDGLHTDWSASTEADAICRSRTRKRTRSDLNSRDAEAAPACTCELTEEHPAWQRNRIRPPPLTAVT